MRKILTYILIVLGVAAAGGIIWWQLNKKRIVRNEIEKAVSRGTDSTYYIHYDSSRVDALAGNATFYNVVLQSDSLQQKLFLGDTTGEPRTIFNVHIKRLSISGANIPSFLQKNKIEASSIEIAEPSILVISTGKQAATKLTKDDTLALYEKLTGKFNSIQAGEIKVTDGTLGFARGNEAPGTLLEGINVDLKNFRVDSTRDYDNIISYFVKDVVADVKTTTVKSDRGERVLIFKDVEYNAPGRFLHVGSFTQTAAGKSEPLIALSNTRVSGLSTNSFILNRTLKADSLTTDGGVLGFYSGTKAGRKTETLELDNDFFDEAILKNIRLGSTTLTIFKRGDNNAVPMVLKNLKFHAADIDSLYSGTDILELIGRSNWDLSADGLAFNTGDKVYHIDIGPFVLDNFHSLVTVKSAAVTPIPTRDQFVRTIKFQTDLYDLRFNNIRLTGADVKKLLTDKTVIADDITLQPVLKIFNDRTVTPDTASKIGQYPQQLLQKLTTPVYIKTIHANNALVHYTERGAISKKTGDVIFSNIQGLITNFTNIPAYLNRNNIMVMKVTARFNNIAGTKSTWTLPLNSPQGSFAITGSVGHFNGEGLNPVIEPLGMGSINKGIISSYTFTMTGDNLHAEGPCTLIYHDLNISLLKNSGDADNDLRKKKVTSAIANVVIQNDNPSKGRTRTGTLNFKRVTTKTFFNLVWKSLFAGAKSSTK